MIDQKSELLVMLDTAVGVEKICDSFEYGAADLKLLALCMREGATTCPVVKGEVCPFGVSAEKGLAQWGTMGQIAFPQLKF